MDVALAIVSHDGLGPVAVPLVALNVDAQAAVDLEAQEDLVVDGIPATGGGGIVAAVDALELELLQAGLEVGGRLGEALDLDLGVAGGLGRAELARVEPRNVRRVVGRRVRRHEVVVLRRPRRQLSRELLERCFGLAHPQVARLLERRQGFADACYRELVWLDVEVVDGVVDELPLLVPFV